jgi:phosphoribosyl-AMP cyclohydrolase
LGALEKTMKKKTTTLRFWPRRRPWLWELGKNHGKED